MKAGESVDVAGERRGRFVLLAALLAAGFLASAFDELAVAAPVAVVATVLVSWAALSLLLWTHRRTLGREGTYVDLWSITHLLSGSVLRLFGVGLAWVAVLAILWELVEVASRVRETPANRVIDVVLALAGWLLAQALLG